MLLIGVGCNFWMRLLIWLVGSVKLIVFCLWVMFGEKIIWFLFCLIGVILLVSNLGRVFNKRLCFSSDSFLNIVLVLFCLVIGKLVWLMILLVFIFLIMYMIVILVLVFLFIMVYWIGVLFWYLGNKELWMLMVVILVVVSSLFGKNWLKVVVIIRFGVSLIIWFILGLWLIFLGVKILILFLRVSFLIGVVCNLCLCFIWWLGWEIMVSIW